MDYLEGQGDLVSRGSNMGNWGDYMGSTYWC